MSPVREKQTHILGRPEEIAPGESMIVEVDGREFGIFNVGGSFYALPNACHHQNGPLCRGQVSGTTLCHKESGWKPVWSMEGEVLRCPWHNMEYRITSGECISDPGRRVRVRVVTVSDGELRMEL